MSQNRVLILDDDPRICSFVSRVAKNKGYEACAIEQPEKFADSYFSFDPSLIMLDLKMGKYDGLEILEFLATHQAKTPIVLISGVDRNIIESASLYAKSRHLKIANTCSKPFESELLTNIFNRFYKNKEIKANVDNIQKSEIIEAMEDHSICAYYQPVYSLLNKDSYAIELLARWKSSNHQSLTPNELIRTVQSYDLLEEFTLHLLEKGIKNCLPTLERKNNIKISINVTIELIQSIDFHKRLMEILISLNRSPEQLILEVENFSSPININSTLNILSELRQKGFMLAIDNFDDTALPLIEKLQLPFTEIKFKQNFIAQLLSGQANNAEAKETIKSMRLLGMDCCVKGVDSKEKFLQAQQLDIEFVQGHYICKPLSSNAINAWV